MNCMRLAARNARQNVLHTSSVTAGLLLLLFLEKVQHFVPGVPSRKKTHLSYITETVQLR